MEIEHPFSIDFGQLLSSLNAPHSHFILEAFVLVKMSILVLAGKGGLPVKLADLPRQCGPYIGLINTCTA